ncbi:MAG: glycosyltransferase family 39 protein [Anaerolineae bacterium]|nr:glycosyltransferase family 39 protein [Anaerolineae bacterium]
MFRSRAWLYGGLWIALLLGAAALRFVAPDWDAGIAAHPDERFLLGAAEAVTLMSNICRAVPDFPYGHLPVILARLIVIASPGADPLYAARLLSALIGVLLVALAGAAGRRLAGRKGALFSGIVVALSPGLIQQAHFYTVDPIGAVFAGSAVLAATRRRWRAAGLLTGLAVSCKLSLTVTAVALLGAALLHARGRAPFAGAPAEDAPAEDVRPWRRLLRVGGAFAWPAVVAFLVASPWSLLTPVACWRGPLAQSMLVSGRYVLPYTQQYAGSLPFVYPLVQMGLWGLGPVVTVMGGVGLVVRGAVSCRSRQVWGSSAWLWTVVFFAATSALAVKLPRYLLPLYPWWAAWGAYLLWGRGVHLSRGWVASIAGLAVATTAILGLAQAGLYAMPHPWDTASRWLTTSVPPGATLAIEAWDHPLPVPATYNEVPTSNEAGVYVQISLPVYDDESPAKLARLAGAAEADVLILASRRGYGALSREPVRYPETLAWYRAQLERREAYVFTRCPIFGPVAITDDPLADAGLPVPSSLAERCGTQYALRLPRLDESFRVYDAPLTVILAEDAE